MIHARLEQLAAELDELREHIDDQANAATLALLRQGLIAAKRELRDLAELARLLENRSSTTP